MSLTIIKAGLLDTVQDLGRYGYAHLGINTGGAMDRFAAQLANSLLGKSGDAAVIEMHYPAPRIRFEEATIFCLSGADFGAQADGEPVTINQPFVAQKGTILSFNRRKTGARCYLAVRQPLLLPQWLNSYCTHLKAGAGGYGGRALRSGDVIDYAADADIGSLAEKHTQKSLPYFALPPKAASSGICIMKGNEWQWLSEESRNRLTHQPFTLAAEADRMGYRLSAEALQATTEEQLISSAVSFGTLQLLPDGQLILLMADHQTTGGYPRIAHVISAHLPLLAQMNARDTFTFTLTDIISAEQAWLAQQHYLASVRWAAHFTLSKLLA